MNSIFFHLSQLLDYKNTIKTRMIYNTEKVLAAKSFTTTTKGWHNQTNKPNRIFKAHKPPCSCVINTRFMSLQVWHGSCFIFTTELSHLILASSAYSFQVQKWRWSWQVIWPRSHMWHLYILTPNAVCIFFFLRCSWQSIFFSPDEHHRMRCKMPQLPESGISHTNSVLSKKKYADFIVAEGKFKMLITVSL